MEKFHPGNFIKFIHLRQQNMFIVLFFALLFFGLFLGDGKQGVIEVYSCSVVLVCWAVFFLYKNTMHPIPKHLYIPWLAFATIATLSTTQSDSIGFSISWFARFSCGYSIYRLFYSLSSKQAAKIYIYGVVMLVCGAIILSLFSSVAPWFRDVLPSMNLIDIRHGHSHLAELLVYMAPTILCFGLIYPVAPKTLKMLVAIGYYFALFFTYARGAWLVVLLFYLSQYKSLVKTRRLWFNIAALGVMAVGILLFLSITTNVSTQLVRPITVASRVEYWRQAKEAFQERPFFGSGPGTFSLISQRFQKTSGQSSWFAHSFIVQTLVETGVFGLVALLWLLGVHITHWLINRDSLKDTAHALIFQGGLLLLLYGVFEFVLDYQVIWLLFWGGAGLITGAACKQQCVEKKSTPLGIAQLYVAVFYFLWVVGSIFVMAKQYVYAFVVEPHDATITLAMLSEGKASQSLVDVAVIFHRKNSQILLAAAKQASKRNQDTSYMYLIDATRNDQANVSMLADTLKLLVDENQLTQVAHLLNSHTEGRFDFTHSIIRSHLSSELINDIDASIPMNEYLAKLYYALGYSILDDAPDLTKKLWTMARDEAPSWAYFHVELASLELHILHNSIQAHQVIERCLNTAYAKYQCSITNIKESRPGDQRDNVYAIPQILQ